MAKEKFYSLDNILKENADYNVIYGERSNGKTTAVLGYALEQHIKSNYVDQLAIIRRWEEDYKGKNGKQMFDGIIALGWIEQWTKGKYNSIYYMAQRWFLCKYDEFGNKIEQAENPFALGFSITSEEHYKSTSYPNVKFILFDEFITRNYYLPEEFIKFQNLLSTIIRLRTDVIIFMCGNTVNKYCPYFAEMGLTGVKKQLKGTIDVYSYGESTLKVAVEYSDFPSKKKASNKYFAFNNPKLQMITHGSWEIDIYPHLPVKYWDYEVKYMYFIKFDDAILHCKIIHSKELNTWFTYIHRKTTDIKDYGKYIVFQQEHNVKVNYRRKITKVTDDLGRKILWFFENDKVFYQDNEIGEVVRNYLMWCKKEGL